MQAWPNVNNCKEYAPYFIFFLDCVNQLMSMNLYQFEFTRHYLVHIAVNCFSTKHFELNFPIIVHDMINGNKQSTDDVKLMSIFQLEVDTKNTLFKNQSFDKTLNSKNELSVDPSQISLWKEYFCRFDENKRESMGHQLETAEVKETKAIDIEEYEESIQEEIEQLLEKLRKNQKRIEQIRTMGSGAPEGVAESSFQIISSEVGAEVPNERPKNGCIKLDRLDLQVIQDVQAKI